MFPMVAMMAIQSQTASLDTCCVSSCWTGADDAGGAAFTLAEELKSECSVLQSSRGDASMNAPLITGS